jgi:mono/diheme cytochrome c family protein
MEPSRILALACFCLTTAACSSSGNDGGAASVSSAQVDAILALTPDLSAGNSIYTTECVSCHGTDARSGSERRDVAGDAVANPSGAVRQILGGGGGMPSFASYSDQQVADLLGYVKSLN